jgi:replicative DNA helicase
MKRLLRGVIDFEDGKVNIENLRINYQRLVASRVDWMQAEDKRIFAFIKEYFQGMLDIPSSKVLVDFFIRADDIEVQERLKDIEAAQVYTRTSYAHLLNQLLEDQNRVKMRNLLKETEEIVSKGLVVQEDREKTTFKGVKDGLLYFNQRVHELIPADFNVRTRGDLRDDTELAWQEYQTAKVNQGKVWGRFTGIEGIDDVCHGCKKGELWVHAGYAGHLKTTMAVNWAYNLVTRYRTNVFYVSMEMPFDQIRRLIYVIHSSNPKFRNAGKEALDYRKVRDGELSAEEEKFYQEVLKDFNENKEYCRFEVWCPDRDITIDDIRIETELLHKQLEVGFVILDHGGLMEARKGKKHKDYVIELNSVIRDSKKFALHFNGGEGMATLMLFQINRQGLEAADKNEGKYKMSALAYANETERSADYVTTTYLNDQHRTNGTTLCCNLKNRDNPLFEPVMITVDFASRRLHNRDPFADGNDMSADSGLMGVV